MRFSIVIPTYEMNGKAIQYLDKLLSSIKNQTFTDYEIIISDHSKNDIIKNYIENHELKINYYKNEHGVGNSSINMNNGIKSSNGEYIKIIHMDDFICNNDMLLKINNKILETNKCWGGVGFNHIQDENYSNIKNIIIPAENNFYGCPSISFFKNDENYFDENLIYINDKDIHTRLHKKYGVPICINDVCMTIRLHGNQVSNLMITNEIKNKENNYFNSKVI